MSRSPSPRPDGDRDPAAACLTLGDSPVVRADPPGAP